MQPADYLSEFLTLAGLHFLAVASPGPDFAMVLRQSIARGRGTAIVTSLGIGCGISVHIAYTLLGVGLVVKNSPTAFTVLKLVGAAYLVWLGYLGIRSRPRSLESATDVSAAPLDVLSRTWKAAFVTGFVTNATNVKATLFFVSIFSVIVSPSTPYLVQVGYGAWMVLMTAAWFMMVSFFFTHPPVRRRFIRVGHWFDRVMGVFLIALGVKLALSHR